jgi:hypothetical protein
VKHIVELCSCFLFHLSRELYCNCTLHGICIIHSCAAAVYYAYVVGGAALSEHTVVLCPYITRILHT